MNKARAQEEKKSYLAALSNYKKVNQNGIRIRSTRPRLSTTPP